MKKRFCASVMVALVLVAALATCASAAAVITINGPVTVQQGENVTLQVQVSNVEGVTADVEATGLEIVSFSGGLSDATSLLLLEPYGGMTATYVYRVTASPGQTASFTLRNVIESQNMIDTPRPDSSWQATVVSGDTPASESPSAPASDQPSNEPSQNSPAVESPGTSTPPGDQQSQAPASESPGASAPASVEPSASNPPQQGGEQSQAPGAASPTIGATTPPGASSSAGQGGAVITVQPSNNAGGTTGGTTVVRLPKTADATTNMWLFASLTAAVGTIAIIAAKKCSIGGKKEAHDEQ